MFELINMFPISEQSGHTCLMRAALDGQAKIVRDLLKEGADVNARDHEGRTALMFAAINSHSAIVGILLDHGAYVNDRAKDGGTALMRAAASNAADIVQILLHRGADVSGKFIRNNATALLIAKDLGYTKIANLIETATPRNRRQTVEPQDPRHDAHLSLISSRAPAGSGD